MVLWALLFQEKIWNTIRVSNHLDPNQDQCSVQTVCKVVKDRNTCNLKISKDPDEMQHNAALHRGLHFFAKVKTIFRDRLLLGKFYL